MQQENQRPPVKFFVDENKEATIVCQKCGHTKTIDTRRFKQNTKRFKIRCKCGESFIGELEYRKHYRKSVRLPGWYIHSNSDRKAPMTVEDISLQGVGFRCRVPHGINPGDYLDLNFRLDDANKSEINIKVVVKSCRDGFIGVERTDVQGYQAALGFYLRR